MLPGSNYFKDPQAIINIFGKKAYDALNKDLNPCCLEISNSLCLKLQNCLGITPAGDPTLFINQQGNFVEAGGVTPQPLSQIIYGSGTGITSDFAATRQPLDITDPNNPQGGSTSFMAANSGVVSEFSNGIITSLNNIIGSALINTNNNTNIVSFTLAGDGSFLGITSDSSILGISDLSNGSNKFVAVSTNGISIGSTTSNYLLPSADGIPNQVLLTNGTGQTSWTSIYKVLNYTTSGDGSSSIITIPHGLSSIPKAISVNIASSDAAVGLTFNTFDANNIYINYGGNIPSAGVNNLSYNIVLFLIS